MNTRRQKEWYALPQRAARLELLAELRSHILESLVAAERGDYTAREWLCQTFPGNVRQFRRLWADDLHRR